MQLLYPFKVFFTCTNLKVILGDTQIHLGVAKQRETFAGFHSVAIVLHSNILKVGSINSFFDLKMA